MGCLSEIEDPCKPSNGTLHDYREILAISIAAMFSVFGTVEDVAFWARKKKAWVRRFLVLKNGVPSEETFLRIFRVLDPKQFETVFRRWVWEQRSTESVSPEEDRAQPDSTGYYRQDQGQFGSEAQRRHLG